MVFSVKILVKIFVKASVDTPMNTSVKTFVKTWNFIKTFLETFSKAYWRIQWRTLLRLQICIFPLACDLVVYCYWILFNYFFGLHANVMNLFMNSWIILLKTSGKTVVVKTYVKNFRVTCKDSCGDFWFNLAVSINLVEQPPFSPFRTTITTFFDFLRSFRISYGCIYGNIWLS